MNRQTAYPIRLIAIAVAYAATARLGQVFAIDPGNVTAVWIPSGIAVGALVLWGWTSYPGVWLGAFAYNLWFFLHSGIIDRPNAMFLAVGIATGNTLMAIASTTMIGAVRGYEEDLGRPRDALAYLLLAGFLATTISATVGTTMLLLGGVATNINVGLIWTTWWLGDANGVALIAPLMVLFGRLGFPRFLGQRKWVAVAAAAGLVILLAVTFGRRQSGVTTIGLALPVAFLAFTAFLLGRRATVLAAFAIGVTATYMTATGRGPLVGSSLNDSLMQLHSFLDTAVLTGLLLATTVRGARHLAVPAAQLRSFMPIPEPDDLHRQMEHAIAQRRREETALADRVRALAEEARTLERQLERRALERDAVLGVFPDLFYVIDRDTQRITMASEAFANLVAGIGRDALIGRTMYDVLSPELALRLGEQHREVFSTGDPLHITEILPLPGGALEVDTLKAPFRGPDGEVTGLVSSSRRAAPIA